MNNLNQSDKDLDLTLSLLFAEEGVDPPAYSASSKRLYGTEGTLFSFDHTTHIAHILDMINAATSAQVIVAMRSQIGHSIAQYESQRAGELTVFFKEQGIFDLLNETEKRLTQAEAQKRVQVKREQQDRMAREKAAREAERQAEVARKQAIEDTKQAAKARQQALAERSAAKLDEKAQKPGIFKIIKIDRVVVELYIGFSNKGLPVVRVNSLSSPVSGLTKSSTYKADLSNAPQILKMAVHQANLDIDALMKEAEEKRDRLKAEASKPEEMVANTQDSEAAAQ